MNPISRQKLRDTLEFIQHVANEDKRNGASDLARGAEHAIDIIKYRLKRGELDACGDDEIWRAIQGFPRYEISTKGAVRSVDLFADSKHGPVISHGQSIVVKNGIVVLYKNGRKTSRSVAVLLSKTFGGSDDN